MTKNHSPFDLIAANVHQCLQLAKKEDNIRNMKRFIALAELGIRMLELYKWSYRKWDFRFTKAKHVYIKGELFYTTVCTPRLTRRDGWQEWKEPFTITLGKDTLTYYINTNYEDQQKQHAGGN